MAKLNRGDGNTTVKEYLKTMKPADNTGVNKYLHQSKGKKLPKQLTIEKGYK